MRRTVAAFIALTLLLAAGCSSPPGELESLRIATFNAYLLSPVFRCASLSDVGPDCLNQVEWPVLTAPFGGVSHSCTLIPANICDGITEGWARDLADAILADVDFIDILALNEVWDDDARAILIERLAPYYRPIISEIDTTLVTANPSGLAIAAEDSGLMLFARLDFVVEPLPNGAFRWGVLPTQLLSAATPEVAFARFDQCGGFDCYAAKGAALVRLRRQAGERVYNVVLTHMQADYFDENEIHETARDGQFAQIEALIRATLAPLDQRLRDGEVVVLLGDLNVTYLRSRTEYDKRFVNPQSFFRSPLFETWDLSSSPADLTVTNGNDRERFDYVLVASGPLTPQTANVRAPCVQNVTVPVRFRNLQSDHNMVHADINRGFPHCSPSIAYPIELAELGEQRIVDNGPGPNPQDVTEISRPGAMQWFEVRATGAAKGTGSYSIGHNSPQVALDIFLPEDMTTPKAPYYRDPKAFLPTGKRQAFTVRQYTLPERFFIRTRGIDRSTVADYALVVYRHACSSKEDACLLEPDTLQTAYLSAAVEPTQLTPQDEAWFRFDAVGAASSGAPQTLAITAAIDDDTRVTASVEDFVDPLGGPPLVATAMSNVIEFGGPVGAGGRGYLVARQSSRGAERTPIRVTLASNLRFLEIGQLICRDETNPELGSDEIFSVFSIDSAIGRAPGSGDVEFECDNNDDPHDWRFAFPPAGRVAYVESATVRIQEGDDVSADDESAFKSVIQPSPGTAVASGRLSWQFDGGHYELEHSVHRRPNEPAAKAP